MKTGISGNYYASREQADRERAAFARGIWMPACMADEVANHNDFVVRDIAWRPVVIQNFDGEIKAFLNVCPHRLNAVQTQPSGNRPMVCGYHGWEFGPEGMPCRVPARKSFDGFDAREHAMMAYDVARCGNLIFVCREPAVDLQKWLGGAWERVERMTNACHSLIEHADFSFGCNWKIAVENTLESYHVGHVHPETFHRLGASGGSFVFDGAHSFWSSPLSEKAAAAVAKAEDLFPGREYQPDGYEHQLVFPNCTIASVAGMSVSVQFFNPFSATGLSGTRLISRPYTAPSTADDATATGRLELFRKSVADFNAAVFNEDRRVCESVGDGAAAAGDDLCVSLSNDEARVAHHMQAVLEACEGLS
jgi:phenylpropionate dioxygenase-like ring-hydroxylating dioxygenase large terminal subunit